MKQRLTSLMLLLVLCGGAFAGVPLHFGESECGMAVMMEMDCCKAALMQRATPELDTARLLCALSCAQNGATSPPNIVRVTPPSTARLATHPAIAQALLNTLLPLPRTDQLYGPPRGLPPAYIRHLALLI